MFNLISLTYTYDAYKAKGLMASLTIYYYNMTRKRQAVYTCHDSHNVGGDNTGIRYILEGANNIMVKGKVTEGTIY